jgi:hypothetical protein
MSSGVRTRASRYEVVGGRPGMSVSSMRTGSKYSESGVLHGASQCTPNFKSCPRLSRVCLGDEDDAVVGILLANGV